MRICSTTPDCLRFRSEPTGGKGSLNSAKNEEGCPNIGQPSFVLRDSWLFDAAHVFLPGPGGASVSSSVRPAFQPNSVFASVGSAQMATMSPARRGAILWGTFTPLTSSNLCTSSNTETPLPVPMLKIS